MVLMFITLNRYGGVRPCWHSQNPEQRELADIGRVQQEDQA
jgi:hypothetical protein